jgi:hypothetical protein
VQFGESEKFEGMKKPVEGMGGGRFATVHKKSRKVELKHGKFLINPAKKVRREEKSPKCSFLDDNRLLVV